MCVWKSSINRNIVECKVINKGGDFLSIFCINRNIVECKDDLVSGIEEALNKY